MSLWVAKCVEEFAPLLFTRQPIHLSPAARERIPAQVIGHLARGQGFGRFTQQRRPVVAQVAVGKTPGQQTKHQQRTQERLYGSVSETEGAGPLTVDHDGLIDPTEGVLAEGTVLADALDVQQTS